MYLSLFSKLGKRDGVPKNCVANLDMIMTVRKEWLVERICVLKADKAKEIEEAARFALGIEYVSNK